MLPSVEKYDAIDELDVARRIQPSKRLYSRNLWVFWVICSIALLFASRLPESVGFYLPRFENIGRRATASRPSAWDYSVLSNHDGLKFFPCPDLPDLECTNVVVPKNYFDSTAGTSTVAAAILRGNAKTKKGSIFINPSMSRSLTTLCDAKVGL